MIKGSVPVPIVYNLNGLGGESEGDGKRMTPGDLPNKCTVRLSKTYCKVTVHQYFCKLLLFVCGKKIVLASNVLYAS